MNINFLALTRKDLFAAPLLPWDTETKAKGVILLPVRKNHDSGYSCFSLVPWNHEKLLGRTSACSDVLHIEGIGGCGYGIYYNNPVIPIAGWSIDVLPKAKCINLWCSKRDRHIIISHALSSISVYSADEPL